MSNTIVTEYNFPEEIDPLELDIIINDKITDKGFVAMLFKLATKGYIIAHEKTYVNRAAIIYIYPLVVIPPVLLLLALIFQTDYLWIAFGVFVLPLIFSFKTIFPFIKKRGISKEVTFEATSKPIAGDLSVNEEHFLDVLFDGGKEKYYPSYDTKDPKFSLANYKKHLSFSSNLNDMQDDLSVGLYAKFWAKNEKPNRVPKRFLYFIVALILYLVILIVPRFIQEWNWKYIMIIMLSLLSACLLFFYLFKKYNNNSGRELSPEGLKIKMKYLGFKSYIKVAEKYRMQDQSNESFAKYLPYAIVLDVVEDWKRIFDNLDPQLLLWYKIDDQAGKTQKVKDMSFNLGLKK